MLLISTLDYREAASYREEKSHSRSTYKLERLELVLCTFVRALVDDVKCNHSIK